MSGVCFEGGCGHFVGEVLEYAQSGSQFPVELDIRGLQRVCAQARINGGIVGSQCPTSDDNAERVEIDATEFAEQGIVTANGARDYLRQFEGVQI